MPMTVQGTRRPLTDGKKQAVLKVVETHRAGLWVPTMLYSGVRPEEIVSLMWSGINLTEGKESVTIQRAAEWIKGRASIKCPKGKDKKQGEEARRTIPSRSLLANGREKCRARGCSAAWTGPAKSSGAISV